jgi:hypothetical protein
LPSDDAVRPGRLLDRRRLHEFRDAIAHGMSNTELAARFGMTPRQANGLRMGLTRRDPHLRAASARGSTKPALDRETELRMQAAFLEQKSNPTPTLDHVVRFLRQRGDVVFRTGEGFSVNNRLVLTAEELIGRANRKRAELKQPPFTGTIGPDGAPPASEAGYAGAALNGA